MRFLFSIVLVVSATALACHGLFNEEDAATSYELIKGERSRASVAGAERLPSDLSELIQTYPYTTSAAKARADILEGWSKDPTVSAASSDALDGAWQKIRGEGFGDSLPYAFPPGVAAAALITLIFSILLPRTRFRDFGIAFLVLGAALCWPALSPPDHQLQYVDWFDAVRYPVAWFPQIAVGLLFIAGLVLAGKRRPRPKTA